MSLARTLMNNSALSENTIDITGFAVSENVDIDDDMYLDSACESLVADIYAVDKAYHVADIMGEVKVIKEGLDNSQIDAMLEGMVGAAMKKLADSFKKLWAKIKAWFDSVIKFFKSFLLTGKKFVTEFGKELKAKKTSGFSYNGFKYTLDAGDKAVETAFNSINDRIADCASNIEDYSQISREKVKAMSKDELEKLNDKLDDGEVEFKNFGIKGDTLAEVVEELDKKYRNGETQRDTIEDFAGASVNEMLDMIGGKATKAITAAEKKEKDLEGKINKLIKALNKVEKNDDEDKKPEGDLAYKTAQSQSRVASKLINISKTITSTQVKAWKEACATYQSVLGSFYRWKPAKEDTEVNINTDDDEDNDTAGKGEDTEECKESTLFEAAWNLL